MPLLGGLRIWVPDYALAKLFSYAAGTTTKIDTYSDADLETENTNPIIASAEGLFENIFVTPGVAYKFVLSPSTDTDPPTNPIYTVDNATSEGSGAGESSQMSILTKTANYTVTVEDGSDVLILADATLAAFTITPFTAVGNDGFRIRVVKIDGSANAVTIDPNAGDTINGAATYVIASRYDGITIASDGTNWIGLNKASTVSRVLSKTADYTVTYQDGDDVMVLANATSASLTVTLYTAVGHKGRKVTVKRTDTTEANTVTIDPNASETIEGSATLVLGVGDTAVAVSDGANWVTTNGVSIASTVLAKTANYTVLTTDGEDVTVLVDATSGSATITLYTAVGYKGRSITVKRIDATAANSVTVDPNAAETFEGAATYVLKAKNETVMAVSNGTNWVLRAATPREITSSPNIVSGVLTLNLAESTVFTVALDDNITSVVVQSAGASGIVAQGTLVLTANGTPYTATFGASHLFASAMTYTPTSTNNKQDVLTFFTVNGGTSYIWFVSGQNF